MYSFHSATHKGKLRTNNEDYFLNSEIEGGHFPLIIWREWVLLFITSNFQNK